MPDPIKSEMVDLWHSIMTEICTADRRYSSSSGIGQRLRVKSAQSILSSAVPKQARLNAVKAQSRFERLGLIRQTSNERQADRNG